MKVKDYGIQTICGVSTFEGIIPLTRVLYRNCHMVKIQAHGIPMVSTYRAELATGIKIAVFINADGRSTPVYNVIGYIVDCEQQDFTSEVLDLIVYNLKRASRGEILDSKGKAIKVHPYALAFGKYCQGLLNESE